MADDEKAQSLNMEPPEVIEVHQDRVACDGASKDLGAALGHPRVFLEVGEDGFVDCPYCDRRFVLKGGSGH